METASCLVSLPVSWRAARLVFTSPRALPRGNGIVQAEPTPLNQGIGSQSNDFNQFSTHSLSAESGLTLTVS